MSTRQGTRPIITLITDFGTSDYYVGAMKGVMLSVCPDANIVDITHQIEPQGVLHGAFVLRQTLEWFRSGTVHIAVVDPGVGTQRRILAGRFNDQVIIAPDNGLLTCTNQRWPATNIHHVTQTEFFRETVSTTFHGRDILAPVAAHVASGVALERLGPVTTEVESLDIPAPTLSRPHGLAGCVLYADHFGNLITNIDRATLDAMGTEVSGLRVAIDGVAVGGICNTYADESANQPLALIGSTEMLEIAVNQGRADVQFANWRNAIVHVR